jgi:hypothetical protein
MSEQTLEQGLASALKMASEASHRHWQAFKTLYEDTMSSRQITLLGCKGHWDFVPDDPSSQEAGEVRKFREKFKKEAEQARSAA